MGLEEIDWLLTEWAERLEGQLTKNRPGSLLHEACEERRLDWVVGGINLRVLIQSQLRLSGVDSPRWNYSNVAWAGPVGSRRIGWIQRCLEGECLDVIERNLEERLKTSVARLSRLTRDELTTPYTFEKP